MYCLCTSAIITSRWILNVSTGQQQQWATAITMYVQTYIWSRMKLWNDKWTIAMCEFIIIESCCWLYCTVAVALVNTSNYIVVYFYDLLLAFFFFFCYSRKFTTHIKHSISIVKRVNGKNAIENNITFRFKSRLNDVCKGASHKLPVVNCNYPNDSRFEKASSRKTTNFRENFSILNWDFMRTFVMIRPTKRCPLVTSASATNRIRISLGTASQLACIFNVSRNRV